MSEFDKKQIFVGNLNTNTTEYSLRDAFRQYGVVTHVNVQKDKNHGFVTFADEATVNNLLASQMIGTLAIYIDGRTVDIKPKIFKEKQINPKINSQQSTPMNPKKVFVAGLQAGTNKSHLDAYFTKWGLITDSYVIPEKNIGFVTFKHASDVQQLLMKTMTGEVHKINNRRVTLQPATGKFELVSKFINSI